MKLFRREESGVDFDRRMLNRVQVDCPARLVLSSEEWSGRLLDISPGGAKMRVSDLPWEGCLGILEWHCHEADCEVAWIRDDLCGLAFDIPIDPEIIEKTALFGGKGGGQAADFGRIPQGRRRSRLSFS